MNPLQRVLLVTYTHKKMSRTSAFRGTPILGYCLTWKKFKKHVKYCKMLLLILLPCMAMLSVLLRKSFKTEGNKKKVSL